MVVFEEVENNDENVELDAEVVGGEAIGLAFTLIGCLLLDERRNLSKIFIIL